MSREALLTGVLLAHRALMRDENRALHNFTVVEILDQNPRLHPFL